MEDNPDRRGSGVPGREFVSHEGSACVASIRDDPPGIRRLPLACTKTIGRKMTMSSSGGPVAGLWELGSPRLDGRLAPELLKIGEVVGGHANGPRQFSLGVLLLAHYLITEGYRVAKDEDVIVKAAISWPLFCVVSATAL